MEENSIMDDSMATRNFKIKFDGPGTANGDMPVLALANALVSISTLISEANLVAYGKDFKYSININSNIRKGSFEIELITNLWQDVVSMFGTPTALALATLTQIVGINVKDASMGAIQVLQKIKSRPIKEVVEDGEKATIILDSEKITIPRNVYKFLESPKARAALDTIIHETLSGPDIDYIQFSENESEPVSITREDADFFVAPTPTEPEKPKELLDITYEDYVKCVQVSFEEKLSWKFYGANGRFNAHIIDEPFLKSVCDGHTQISAKDSLRVKIRKFQEVVIGGVNLRYEVVKVIAHLKAEKFI